MTDITLPQLSDSMEQGTILKWLKSDGDAVARDEDLVEIETDKATMTYTAEAEGTITIVATEGSTLPVGAVIARLGVAGEAAANGESPAAPAPAATANGHSNGDAPAATEQPMPVSEGNPPAPAGEPVNAPPAPADGARSGNGAGRTSPALATPLARRTADVHGVDLDSVAGTGPRGRITRTDVLQAAGIAVPTPAPAAPAPATPAAPAPAAPAPAAAAARAPAPAAGPIPPDSDVQEMTRIQRLIAQRMVQSKTTIPEFEVQTEVVMDAALALRGQLKTLAGDQPAPSVNDLILKACGIALSHHRRVNASYEEGRFILHRKVNIGFAVAADDALIVPTLSDADVKSLGAIAAETRALAERVRTGTVTPGELSGGTFTVSNLGMFGMTAIHPVINPPQVAILGVGATRKVLSKAGEELVEKSVMTLTLAADHRILYGADAAMFLTEIRDLLENPLRIAL